MIDQIKAMASEAEHHLQEELSADDLQALKVKYLGKKGELTQILRGMRDLSADERPLIGAEANRVKEVLTQLIENKLQLVNQKDLEQKLAEEKVDVTWPAMNAPLGSRHPISEINALIIRIFQSLGYAVEDGPEIETDYYNFTALNFPDNHPARDMQDTFFLENGLLLRTHTSPVQIRTMKDRKAPLQIIVPGVVYRHDADNTHSPVFHQIEGLAIGENISMADLKGTLTRFIHETFGPKVPVRFRPSFFPFTEPSAEVDMGCPKCKQTSPDCRMCSGTGWVEILGCGMVHPAVLENVGYDPEVCQGFAFGMGIERIAMIRYGIDDIRLFYEGAIPFLEQFK